MDNGNMTVVETAHYIVDKLVKTDNVALLHRVFVACPKLVQREIIALISEVAAGGFTRYVHGVGAPPSSEQAAPADRQRDQMNYRRLAELAREIPPGDFA